MAFNTSDYSGWLKIGEGNFGTVFRAKQVSLHRHVCIKRSQRLSPSADLEKRMQDEAISMATLQHPHVVAVYEFGSDESWDYIVMEYVYGVALHELSDAPLQMRLFALSQACKGISAIHRKGWVHRDLKPSNILAAYDGQVKVADFGLLLRRDKDSQTREHAMLGTALYMSPEQIAGNQLTCASDLFGLGSMIYEMFAGKAPFFRPDAASAMHAIAYEDCDMEILPEDIRGLIARCLSKDPLQREISADQISETLISMIDELFQAATDSLAKTVELKAREKLVASLLSGAVACEGLGQRRQAYFHLAEACKLSQRTDIAERIRQFDAEDQTVGAMGMRKPGKMTAHFASVLLLCVALVAVLYVRQSLRPKDIGESVMRHEKRKAAYLDHAPARLPVGRMDGARQNAADAGIWIVSSYGPEVLFYIDGKETRPNGDTLRIDPGLRALLAVRGRDTVFSETSEWKAFEVRSKKKGIK